MPKPRIRLLNKQKPHLIQSEDGFSWMCNLPGAGRWYITGDGFTPEQAYDNWYKNNFDRTSGKWHSRHTFLTLRAAGLMTIHPILQDNHDRHSNIDRAPEGNFFTAHQREP